MHNYHSANNAFPKPAITDKEGKPLLSWRVAILPYIEQQELYNKFKLDEPWDSPHNKALLEGDAADLPLPEPGQAPSRSRRPTRSSSATGALFEKGQDVGIADVTDGTSNTLMVVEAKEAVPWTKPDDLTFDPAAADPRSSAPARPIRAASTPRSPTARSGSSRTRST